MTAEQFPISYTNNNDTLFCSVKGEIYIETNESILNAAILKAKELKMNKILLDWRNADIQSSFMDEYEFNKNIHQKVQGILEFKIASLFAESFDSQRMEFGEDMIKNWSMVNIRYFKNVEDSQEWLAE